MSDKKGNIRLNRCPFCGSRAFFDVTKDGSAFVRCDDCGVRTGLWVYPCDAARVWNRRPAKARKHAKRH